MEVIAFDKDDIESIYETPYGKETTTTIKTDKYKIIIRENALIHLFYNSSVIAEEVEKVMFTKVWGEG
jgi:hypothetical protein